MNFDEWINKQRYSFSIGVGASIEDILKWGFNAGGEQMAEELSDVIEAQAIRIEDLENQIEEWKADDDHTN